MNSPSLYVVATPIGNIKDITIRAKEILEKSTLILAEDTRVAKKLFNLLEIPLSGKSFLAMHAQSSDFAMKKAILECGNHEHISLVTDAGTPAISDPGSLFLDTFRKTYKDANVYPIPGVSALVTGISVSGFPANHFEFMGFVPHKKGRLTFFQKIKDIEHAVVFYESPHRFIKTLESLVLNIPDRHIMVGREMTKAFEEYPRGSSEEILKYFNENKDKIRGEFCIVVSPIYYR